MATLHVRDINPTVHARIHQVARARGMTLAQYLEALNKLHETIREVEGVDFRRVLKELNLDAVRC